MTRQSATFAFRSSIVNTPTATLAEMLSAAAVTVRSLERGADVGAAMETGVR